MMEKKTPLYESHVALGAKMVEFGGFLMPVQYPSGILAEHMAVREKAGLFDVSHMGELVFHGEDALENIQHLVTTDISKMLDGDMRYGMFCNDEGGVVDDLIVYRMAQDDYLIVVNAGNRDKDAAWVETHLSGHPGYHDAGNEFGQIAVQGPVSKEILVKLCDEAELPVKYYSFTKAVLTWNGRSAETYVSRSGYTGSFGYEQGGRHRLAVEHAAGGWQGVWAHSLRTGRARYAASGGGNAALRARADRRYYPQDGRASLQARRQGFHRS